MTILSLLLVLAVSQQCDVFKCGGIINNEGGDHAKCAQVSASNSTILQLQKCSEQGYTCSITPANPFIDPSSDFKQWNCGKANTPPPVPVTNLAPGDMCSSDSQCYADATCEGSVCRAADANVGASCAEKTVDGTVYHAGDKMCAPGQFCQVTANNPDDATCQ